MPVHTPPTTRQVLQWGLPSQMKAGRYHVLPGMGTIGTVNLLTTNIVTTAFTVPRTTGPAQFAAVTVEVTTIGTGATIIAALYHTSSLEPTTLALSLGSVDASTLGRKTFPVAMPVWEGAWVLGFQTRTATVGVRAVLASMGYHHSIPNEPTTSDVISHVKTGQPSTGPLPSTFGAFVTAGSTIRVDLTLVT